MPIELRAKGIALTDASAVRPGLEAYEALYRTISPVAGQRTRIDPAAVRSAAQAYDAAGIDSILVPQGSHSADAWTLSAWILAATDRLRVASAVRIGLQAPASAARAYATLYGLSGGRVTSHLILGRDSDMKKEGIFLDTQARYRSAIEYADLYKETLYSELPFSRSGAFHQVQNAWSTVDNSHLPGPLISIPGASGQGIELAARFADIYALYSLPLQETRQLLEASRLAATAHGRSLKFWRDTNFILAQTDAKAWEIAHQLKESLGRRVGAPAAPPESAGHRLISNATAREEVHDEVLYTGISSVLQGWGPALVGSPATVAAAVLRFYELGIDIFSLGLPDGTAQDRELRDELTRLLRLGAARIDAARAAASEPTPVLQGTV